MISDKNKSIVVEPMKRGIKIYDDPVSVLANNPPFEMQMFALNKLYAFIGQITVKQLF